MRIFLVVTLIATLFYSMTALVYSEGGFEGALVVKPYPMYPVVFGGGEAGTWARHNPGQPLPWYMHEQQRVINSFSWEEGEPAQVTIYLFGALGTLLAWVVLAVVEAVRVLMFLIRRKEPNLSIKVVD